MGQTRSIAGWVLVLLVFREYQGEGAACTPGCCRSIQGILEDDRGRGLYFWIPEELFLDFGRRFVVFWRGWGVHRNVGINHEANSSITSSKENMKLSS